MVWTTDSRLAKLWLQKKRFCFRYFDSQLGNFWNMELPENSYGYLLKHGAPFAGAYSPGGLGAHPVKLNMTWHFPDRAIKVKSQKRYEDTYVLSSPKACAICMYSTALVIGVRGGVSGGAADPLGFKNKFQGALCFSGKRSCSKLHKSKKNIYSMQWIQGKSLFQGKRKVAQRSWMEENYIYSEKFQGKLCFQGKRKLFKIFDVNVYWRQWKIPGQLCLFRASASYSKSWTVKKFSIQCTFTWGWSV